VPRRQGLRLPPLPRLPAPPRRHRAHRSHGLESSERLGRYRWQAEQSIAWLFGCRRLRLRYERCSERFYGFGMLACCRLAFNRYTDQTTLRPDRPVLAW
jgi:hypothetical protein